MNQRKEDERFIEGKLQAFMKPPFWLDAALIRYQEVKDHPDRVGVCHNIAVAIIRDLHENGEADGWTWCQGNVDGGVNHSWVEFRELRIDMGDQHKLRIRAESDADTFKIDGEVTRRNAAETVRWVEEWEAQNALAAPAELPGVQDADPGST
jgi:hypothetical protein